MDSTQYGDRRKIKQLCNLLGNKVLHKQLYLQEINTGYCINNNIFRAFCSNNLNAVYGDRGAFGVKRYHNNSKV